MDSKKKQDDIVKQIHKIIATSQYALLENVSEHLGLSSAKKCELENIFIKGGDNESLDESGKKRKTKKRDPSPYNTFIAKKMSELRSGGSKLSPANAMKEAAEAWKKNIGSNQEVDQNIPEQSSPKINIGFQSGGSRTPSEGKSQHSSCMVAVPTAVKAMSDGNAPEQTMATHPEEGAENPIQNRGGGKNKLTRIRFFGMTYLWDTVDGCVYTDDLKNLKQIGKMNQSKYSGVFD